MRRVRLSAAVLVAASLVLAGCGGDEEPSEDSPAAQEIAGGSTLDSTWPLTGLPVEGDDSAAQDAPGDGHQDRQHRLQRPADRPRLGRHGGRGAGRGRADPARRLLLLRAARTRSARSGRCGPATSASSRPVDGAVVTSGAAGETIARIKGAGIPFFQEGAKGIYRDSGRSAPYNVFANLDDDRLQDRPGRAPPGRLPARGATRPTCPRARRPPRSRRRSAATPRTGSSRTAPTTT